MTRRYSIFLLCVATHFSGGSWAQTSIVFLSDTQAPMWVEKIVLRSHNNIEATGLVFADILRQKPTALYILGDVVSLGYKESKWTRMDRYLDSCRKAGIRVSAVLGNHDVMSRARKGEAKFQQRFPDHNRTGFYQVLDSVALIFLNSNFSKLSPPDLEIQQQWYDKTMNLLDKDAGVRVIIVACHHSPFTNSKIVDPSKNVQKYFVPGFLASTKARLFISGHSHNFEQFKHEGKDFLVIGGGGGLSQPLLKKPASEDFSTTYKPMFHYVLMKRTTTGLAFVSRYLKPDFSDFTEGISFSIPYP